MDLIEKSKKKKRRVFFLDRTLKCFSRAKDGFEFAMRRGQRQNKSGGGLSLWVCVYFGLIVFTIGVIVVLHRLPSHGVSHRVFAYFHSIPIVAELTCFDDRVLVPTKAKHLIYS